MSRWEKVIAVVLVALSTIHGTLGFVDRRIPAWTMFKNADRYEYVLMDREGKSHRTRDYFPARAYEISDHRLVFRFARWLVNVRPELGPIEGSVTVWRGLQPRASRAVRYRVTATMTPSGARLWVDREGDPF